MSQSLWYAHPHQAFDYGISIRLGDGNNGIKKLVQMTQVLITIHSSRDHKYTESMIAQILIVIYQKTNNLPSWKMLKSSLSVFNEESGELMFSILARCSLGESGRNSFEYMEKIYTLLHTYRAVDEDMFEDTEKTGPKRNWRKKLDPLAIEATKDWLKLYVRKLKGNQMTFYDKATPDTYKNAVCAARNQNLIPIDTFLKGPGAAIAMFDEQRIAKEFPEFVKKAVAKFTGHEWAAESMGSIWPEFMPRPLSPNEGDGGMEEPGDRRDWQEEAGDDMDAEDQEEKEIPVEFEQQQPIDHQADQDGRDTERDSEDLEDNDGHEDSGDAGSGMDHKHLDDEDTAEDPQQERKSGSRNVDANGNQGSWKDWGNVHSGNLSIEPQRSRRRTNLSAFAPLVGEKTLQVYMDNIVDATPKKANKNCRKKPKKRQ